MGKIAKTRLGVLYGVKNKKRSEAMKGSKGSTCDSVIVNFTKEGFPATAFLPLHIVVEKRLEKHI